LSSRCLVIERQSFVAVCLSFMSFILSFFAVYIVVRCCSYCRSLLFVLPFMSFVLSFTAVHLSFLNIICSLFVVYVVCIIAHCYLSLFLGFDNHTLKNDMWKQFNDNYKWFNLLPHLVSNYNIRMIGMRLVDVTPAIAEKLLATVQRYKDRGPGEIQSRWLGSVNKYKTIFENGFTSNWVTKLFKIVKV